MFNKILLVSALSLCLVAFSSCIEEPCGTDISGTYTFENSTCAVNNHPQTVTISDSTTEFSFEGEQLIINDCEAMSEAGQSTREVSFDEEGFDFAGEFEIDSILVACEGRYTKS